MWASSVLRPKKHGGSFGFHAAVAKTCDWDIFVFLGPVPEKKVFLSPTLDEVLATKTSDVKCVAQLSSVSTAAPLLQLMFGRA